MAIDGCAVGSQGFTIVDYLLANANCSKQEAVEKSGLETANNTQTLQQMASAPVFAATVQLSPANVMDQHVDITRLGQRLDHIEHSVKKNPPWRDGQIPQEVQDVMTEARGLLADARRANNIDLDASWNLGSARPKVERAERWLAGTWDRRLRRSHDELKGRLLTMPSANDEEIKELLKTADEELQKAAGKGNGPAAQEELTAAADALGKVEKLLPPVSERAARERTVLDVDITRVAGRAAPYLGGFGVVFLLLEAPVWVPVAIGGVAVMGLMRQNKAPGMTGVPDA